MTVPSLSLADVAKQLREHAARLGVLSNDAGTELALHLVAMADSVDGGIGEHVHLGCAHPEVRTQDCWECDLTMFAEVANGDPDRAGTIFDGALPFRAPEHHGIEWLPAGPCWAVSEADTGRLWLLPREDDADDARERARALRMGEIGEDVPVWRDRHMVLGLDARTFPRDESL